MAMLAALLLCVIGVGPLQGSPVRTYDQRQQGELNIHAQLDNIVIVLVPTSNIDLFGLKGAHKFGDKPDKNEILQFLQKPHKNDIDRYEIIKDENDNDIKDVSVTPTQNVEDVQHGEKNNEKEEEVVATVEEMKPDPNEKATVPPKSEATEDSPIKEHSTVSESVQELVFKVSIPDELKKKPEPPKDSIEPVHSKEPSSTSETSTPKQDTITESQKQSSEDVQNNESKTIKEVSIEKKDSTLQINKDTSESTTKKLTIEDFIKPVAAKEEITQNPTTSKTLEEPVATKKSSGLVEGARKEKVIRYKPESKWAPGLVDIMAAPRGKVSAKEAEEKQRFAELCAPGSWDTELKTCIMPSDTRSRHELARFLEAMRFGIAIPTPKQ